MAMLNQYEVFVEFFFSVLFFRIGRMLICLQTGENDKVRGDMQLEPILINPSISMLNFVGWQKGSNRQRDQQSPLLPSGKWIKNASKQEYTPFPPLSDSETSQQVDCRPVLTGMDITLARIFRANVPNIPGLCLLQEALTAFPQVTQTPRKVSLVRVSLLHIISGTEFMFIRESLTVFL